MDAEQLKNKIRELLGQNISFNKEFDTCAENIKNIEDNLIEWCARLKKGDIEFKPSPKRDDCIVFIKKIGSSNRCIIIKIKNGVFVEFHLGDHAYYDKLRKELGLKSDSKYY